MIGPEDKEEEPGGGDTDEEFTAEEWEATNEVTCEAESGEEV